MESEKKHRKLLVSVVGPTAVGKTECCVKLAQELDTEVVSADARQFYQEMNIGTAKPTEEEMRGVKHHFIGTHSIEEGLTVGQYEKAALACLQELFRSKSVVILTGGSGLFVDAVVKGLNPTPPADEQIRAELVQQYKAKGLQPLLEKLRKIDEATYDKIDRNNPRRVLRALEICLVTEQPVAVFFDNAPPPAPRPFDDTLRFVLHREREELYERIDRRMDAMLRNGLLEEAKALFPYRHFNALNTVGYQEIFGYLEREYDWEECLRLLKRNSRRYAKRQMTWFRKEADQQVWLKPNQFDQLLRQSKDKLNQMSQ